MYMNFQIFATNPLYETSCLFILGTSITTAKPKPAFHVEPQASMNFKIAKLSSLIDKLVTVDRTGVPKAASELMFCFLEHGSDHQLSDRISKETTKSLQVQFKKERFSAFWDVCLLNKQCINVTNFFISTDLQ